jgi:hypothetical protein
LSACWRYCRGSSRDCARKGNQEVGDREGIAICLQNLGYATARIGDLSAALGYFGESLAEASAIGTVPIALNNLPGIAELEMQADAPLRAAELLGLLLSHPARDSHMEELARPALLALQDRLPADQLAAALERGRSLDLAEVARELPPRQSLSTPKADC